GRLSGRRRAGIIAAVAAVAVAVAVAGCTARPPAVAVGSATQPNAGDLPPSAAVWRRLDSPHFALATDWPGSTAERILRDLEEYFAALTAVCFHGAVPGTERIPV